MTGRLYLKIFLTTTGAYAALHLASVVIFLIAPQLFYFRAWEYFDDIAYRLEGHDLRWSGAESGDLGRKHFFRHNNRRPTIVTTGPLGFRTSGPTSLRRFSVAITGDSTIFGSGLSDRETLPWRLAEIIHTGVFNGGRTQPFNALKHPRLGKIDVLIDAVTERDITIAGLRRAQAAVDWKTPFRPLAQGDRSRVQILRNLPYRRYSLPLIGLKTVKRMARDLRAALVGKKAAPMLFIRHRQHRAEFERIVGLIVARRRMFAGRVGRYVFLAVPAKQTIYADDVDPYTRRFIPSLVAALRKRGVEAVDLTAAFQQARARGLYFSYDTHWNGNGTAVAAATIVGQIFRRTGSR